MQAPQWLVFGPFRLDRRDERLWQGEAVLPVRPKTLAVLCALVAQGRAAHDQRRAVCHRVARDGRQ